MSLKIYFIFVVFLFVDNSYLFFICVALYDAIIKGIEMIVDYDRVNADTYKRVIVLTDGEDTSSASTLQQVKNLLLQHKIKLDIVILGDSVLANISSFPGDCFVIKSNKVTFFYILF